MIVLFGFYLTALGCGREVFSLPTDPFACLWCFGFIVFRFVPAVWIAVETARNLSAQSQHYMSHAGSHRIFEQVRSAICENSITFPEGIFIAAIEPWGI